MFYLHTKETINKLMDNGFVYNKDGEEQSIDRLLNRFDPESLEIGIKFKNRVPIVVEYPEYFYEKN